jgi:hypothetical protein
MRSNQRTWFVDFIFSLSCKDLTMHVHRNSKQLYITYRLRPTLNLYKYYYTHLGRAIAKAVSRWLPTVAARVHTRVWQVGFVVDEVASGQVFSEYFGFPPKPFIPPNPPSSQSPGAVSRGPATS